MSLLQCSQFMVQDTGHKLGDLCTKQRTLVHPWLAGCVVMSAEVEPCLVVNENGKKTLHCTTKANIQGVVGGEGKALQC